MMLTVYSLFFCQDIKIFLHFGIDNGYIFSKGINYSVGDRLLLPKLDIIYNTFICL